MWPAALSSCCLSSATMMNHTFEQWAKINPFLNFFLSIFVKTRGKVTKSVYGLEVGISFDWQIRSPLPSCIGVGGSTLKLPSLLSYRINSQGLVRIFFPFVWFKRFCRGRKRWDRPAVTEFPTAGNTVHIPSAPSLRLMPATQRMCTWGQLLLSL